MQVTASVLEGIKENEGEFVPELIPLTFHWKNGLPPPTTRSFTGHKMEQGKALESVT